MNAVLQPISSYRPMLKEDIGLVVEIEHEIYPFPWTRGNFADSLSAGYSCWINQVDAQTMGYGVMMVAAGEAHLLNFGIAAPWQGRGMGRQFLCHLVDVARDHHAEIMLLEVRTSNIAARRLYARSGFKVLTIRKNYYPAAMGREDAVLMELAL
jgi:ribosomal-protein-alanine N-acetyltransferase